MNTEDVKRLVAERGLGFIGAARTGDAKYGLEGPGSAETGQAIAVFPPGVENREFFISGGGATVTVTPLRHLVQALRENHPWALEALRGAAKDSPVENLSHFGLLCDPEAVASELLELAAMHISHYGLHIPPHTAGFGREAVICLMKAFACTGGAALALRGIEYPTDVNLLLSALMRGNSLAVPVPYEAAAALVSFARGEDSEGGAAGNPICEVSSFIRAARDEIKTLIRRGGGMGRLDTHFIDGAAEEALRRIESSFTWEPS